MGRLHIKCFYYVNSLQAGQSIQSLMVWFDLLCSATYTLTGTQICPHFSLIDRFPSHVFPTSPVFPANHLNQIDKQR